MTGPSGTSSKRGCDKQIHEYYLSHYRNNVQMKQEIMNYFGYMNIQKV